ncbi:uncharacterized protein LOC123806137 [Phyllostomus hastatus]|uniref:uncharacterized protein LOC123806137 n=1 Tax=Phyllostomus hastatus TaxID=9423 RepID=UPI001E6824D2|nr:uncharacterized protein LOC123806137 [Phyllostomus hastatus]
MASGEEPAPRRSASRPRPGLPPARRLARRSFAPSSPSPGPRARGGAEKRTEERSASDPRVPGCLLPPSLPAAATPTPKFLTVVGNVPIDEDEEEDGGESGTLALDHVQKRLPVVPCVQSGCGLWEDTERTRPEAPLPDATLRTACWGWETRGKSHLGRGRAALRRRCFRGDPALVLFTAAAQEGAQPPRGVFTTPWTAPTPPRRLEEGIGKWDAFQDEVFTPFKGGAAPPPRPPPSGAEAPGRL